MRRTTLLYRGSFPPREKQRRRASNGLNVHHWRREEKEAEVKEENITAPRSRTETFYLRPKR
jgi:hypothetical protein